MWNRLRSYVGLYGKLIWHLRNGGEFYAQIGKREGTIMIWGRNLGVWVGGNKRARLE